MSIWLSHVLPGFQPVLASKGQLFLFRRGTIFRADRELRERQPIARIPPGRWQSRIPLRLAERVFREHIQSAAELDDGTILLARHGSVWWVDPASGETRLDLQLPDGRKLLAFGEMRDVRGDRYICFGEYFYNPARAPVWLWRRKAESSAAWERCGAFPNGAIEHIHAVGQLPDDRIYVLTGDFGEASGIWLSEPALETFDPVLRGQQAYRACWLHTHPDGQMFMATDSQFERNRLFRFLLDPPRQEEVGEFGGSSIYAGTTGLGTAFSTAIEPGHSTGSRILDLFDTKPGPSIVGSDAEILLFEKGQLHQILRSPKDFWPMRLAQFGTFMFPAGRMPADRFWAYGVAIDRFDGCCLTFTRPS